MYNRHKVSVPALELLKKLYDEPLYNIQKINPFLFESIGSLKQVKLYRQQLYYIKDYLITCNREKKNVMRLIDPSRRHLVYDKNVSIFYS